MISKGGEPVRPIDADAVIEDALQEYALSKPYRDAVIRMVRKAETIEPLHGEWKARNDYWDGDIYYICSACGEPWVLIDGTPQENNMNYCPNCGAKMEGADDE